MWGLVPLVTSGGQFADADRWRHAIVAGTDPTHPGYWGPVQSCRQAQVEQPAIAFSLVMKPELFWNPLSFVERGRLVEWLYRTNEVDIVDSNWRWFRVLVNACLCKLGEKWSREQLDSDLHKIDGYHPGGGWYRDENRKPTAKLDVTQQATVAQITQDKEVRKAAALACRFTALVQVGGISRRRAPGVRLAALTRWLSQARTCGVQALQTFAAGVQHDLTAIKAALTTGWSNGQTEGHVNKLKLLKRHMYGRAKFDLLRRRLLLAS